MPILRSNQPIKKQLLPHAFLFRHSIEPDCVRLQTSEISPYRTVFLLRPTDRSPRPGSIALHVFSKSPACFSQKPCMFSGKPFEVNLNSLATILVFSQSIAGNRLDIFLKSTIQEKDIIYHISNPLRYMKRIFSYLLSVHLSALLVFTLFRGTLYFLQSDLVPASDQAYRLDAFLMGLRFDNVICCYILTVPLLLLIASAYLPRFHRGIYRAVHLWFCLFYSLAFLISAADIPYFIQFFNRLNASIWNWLDEPSFVFTMMAQEKSFLVYGILFIGIDIAFCYLLLFLKNKILMLPLSLQNRDFGFLFSRHFRPSPSACSAYAAASKGNRPYASEPLTSVAIRF